MAGSLRKAQEVAIFGPNTLVLRVPPAYNLAGDPYLDATRLAKVEEVLTRIVGQPCSLRLEITGPTENGCRQDETTVAETGAVKRQRQRAEIAQVPLIGRAMDVLGGQIVHIDEEFGAPPPVQEIPQAGDATEEG